MKAREFIRLVRAAGGHLHRMRGDHAVYRLPNGRLIDIPQGGTRGEVGIYKERQLERLLNEGPGEWAKKLV